MRSNVQHAQSHSVKWTMLDVIRRPIAIAASILVLSLLLSLNSDKKIQSDRQMHAGHSARSKTLKEKLTKQRIGNKAIDVTRDNREVQFVNEETDAGRWATDVSSWLELRVGIYQFYCRSTVLHKLLPSAALLRVKKKNNNTMLQSCISRIFFSLSLFYSIYCWIITHDISHGVFIRRTTRTEELIHRSSVKCPDSG